MIKGVFVVNNHGNVRLARFYDDLKEAEQQKLIAEIHSSVSRRGEDMCNFLEGLGPSYPDSKLIYRHYATLFFIFWVDSSESELAILDLIQVWVETLDKCFENVCELDIIFHVDRVHFVLDEIVMGGMVVETNLANVIQAVEAQNKLDGTMTKPQKKGGLPPVPVPFGKH